MIPDGDSAVGTIVVSCVEDLYVTLAFHMSLGGIDVKVPLSPGTCRHGPVFS